MNLVADRPSNTEEVETMIRPRRKNRERTVMIEQGDRVRVETDGGAFTFILLDANTGRAQVVYDDLSSRRLPEYIQFDGAKIGRCSYVRLWIVKGAKLQITVSGQIILLPTVRHVWINGQGGQIF